MAKVDMELKKAFAELQQKAIDTAQKLKLSDVQIDSLKRTKQLSVLTEREIHALDSDTKTFESVGRIFVYVPLPEIKENLKERQKTCDEKIKTYESNKEYLEKNLKEAENNLRELVQQRKDLLE